MNTETKKLSPFKGVTFIKTRNRWLSRITFDGRSYTLGTFKQREDAEAVYAAAYALGGPAVRAWCSRDPKHRGSIIPVKKPECTHAEAGERIKTFSFLVADLEEAW